MKTNPMSGPRKGGIKSVSTTPKPNIKPSGQVCDLGPTYNISFTSSRGTQVSLSLDTLIKVMEDMPKPPRILTMDIKLLEHPLLDGNTILISSEIAKALEEAMGE